jgi:hypothetical protein
MNNAVGNKQGEPSKEGSSVINGRVSNQGTVNERGREGREVLVVQGIKQSKCRQRAGKGREGGARRSTRHEPPWSGCRTVQALFEGLVTMKEGPT